MRTASNIVKALLNVVYLQVILLKLGDIIKYQVTYSNSVKTKGEMWDGT
jgi:hypothetical protein